jgi:PAS domain S-box-containing protein
VLERLERFGTQSFTASDETGSPLVHELRMDVTARRSDDSSFHAELFLRRVDLACGRSGLHYVGTLHDLSDRQEAEAALAASERRLRALFNQEFQFIGLMRPDGTLIEVNQPVLDLAGTTRAEQLGRFLWDTVWWSHSPQLQGEVRSWTERAARGEFVRNEVEILGQDGRLSTVDFSIKPLRDDEGRIELLIPEGRDITELVRARRRETAMLESLAEIGESASILAHEVKNPITALNLALRAVSGGMGADERILVEELVTRMQRLERQIRRTLSFTKPVELEPSRCDLELLVDDVLAELRPELGAAGIGIEVDFPSADTTLMADEQLLRQVVENLLRNALEALTRSDGAASPEPHRPHDRPRVLVCLHRREPEGSLELAIHDSGPGVPVDMREDLFRPYFTTKARGTGLGLALCRKIVREHGGSIELGASRLGGARFAVRLPGGSA